MPEISEQLRRIEDIVTPICLAHGLEMVDARFCYDRGMILRVMIERVSPGPGGPSGVSIQDCQAVTHDLLTALEVEREATLRGEYRVEVSSPGLDRPLFRLKDFRRFEGNEVKIQTSKPLLGRRRFRGRLLGVEGEDIRIEQDGAVVTIPYPDIAKANLVPNL